jgi:hypothetical protein
MVWNHDRFMGGREGGHLEEFVRIEPRVTICSHPARRATMTPSKITTSVGVSDLQTSHPYPKGVRQDRRSLRRLTPQEICCSTAAKTNLFEIRNRSNQSTSERFAVDVTPWHPLKK